MQLPHTQLSRLILTYWQEYYPTMLAQFEQENRLQQELEAKMERFNDLLYHLMVEQKIADLTAREIAIHEILPVPKDDITLPQNLNDSPPATSE